jgi:hypothetical protein
MQCSEPARVFSFRCEFLKGIESEFDIHAVVVDLIYWRIGNIVKEKNVTKSIKK